MNCERFIALIDDYHAGPLDPALRVAADAHLGGCRRCQSEYAALKRVLRLAGELPAELEPGHDLWPGIAARLAPRASQARPRGLVQYALAATIVLAVAGMATLVFRVAPQGEVVPLARSSGDARPALLDGGRAAGRAQLVAQLTAQEGSMSNSTRDTVVRNLLVIEQALAEIDAAVKRDPNDPNLRALLTAMHQQESALIEQTQRITVNQAKRTDI
jgi:hypothetical protein